MYKLVEFDLAQQIVLISIFNKRMYFEDKLDLPINISCKLLKMSFSMRYNFETY